MSDRPSPVDTTAEAASVIVRQTTLSTVARPGRKCTNVMQRLLSSRRLIYLASCDMASTGAKAEVWRLLIHAEASLFDVASKICEAVHRGSAGHVGAVLFAVPRVRPAAARARG